MDSCGDPQIGQRAFHRFAGGCVGTLGYYRALVEILAARHWPVARVLDALVDGMQVLAGRSDRQAARRQAPARWSTSRSRAPCQTFRQRKAGEGGGS